MTAVAHEGLVAELQHWAAEAPQDHPETTQQGRRLVERLRDLLDGENVPDDADQTAAVVDEYLTWLDAGRPRGEDAEDWDSERDGLWENVQHELEVLLDGLVDEPPEGDAPAPGPRRAVWVRRGASPLDALPTDFDVETTPRAKREELFERVVPAEPVYLVWTGSTVRRYVGLTAARAGVRQVLRDRIWMARQQAASVGLEPRTRDYRRWARTTARAFYNAVPVKCEEEQP